ncbi:MAG TPA: hypothetical protein VH257_21300, partial [Chloroflexota bacterium]|nr:hypothetical protein [Chloroflexota bacterium]
MSETSVDGAPAAPVGGAPSGPGREQRRRQREQQREAQLEARRRLETQARRRRQALWAAGIGAGVLALGLLIYWLWSPGAAGAVQSFPIQGQL